MRSVYHNNDMNDKILGLDIGGTKIRAILWDGKRVVKEKEKKTPKKRAVFIKTLRDLIARFGNGGGSSGKLKIGIGIAGAVSGRKVIFSPNIKYLKNFDLKNLLTSDVHSLTIDVGRPKIKLDNDARCFLRAEINASAFLRKKRVLGLTLGTGIGRAFVKNGKVLKIKKFEYPEKWEREYQKIRDLKNNPLLADFLAKKLPALFGKYPPDIMVISGGVLKRKNFAGLLRSALRKNGFKKKILETKMGQNPVAIGAALLFE